MQELSEQFFQSNPLNERSVPYLTYLRMEMLKDKPFSVENDPIASAVFLERSEQEQEEIRQEILKVEELTDPADLVNMLRKTGEMWYLDVVWRKIVEDQEHTMPLLLKRFSTSGQEQYLESAAIVLTHAEEPYIRQLWDHYPTLRNPAAKADACLVFAVRNDPENQAFFLAEYERMMRMDGPDFAQAPLIGLYVLAGKINP